MLYIGLALVYDGYFLVLSTLRPEVVLWLGAIQNTLLSLALSWFFPVPFFYA